MQRETVQLHVLNHIFVRVDTGGWSSWSERDGHARSGSRHSFGSAGSCGLHRN